MRFLQIPESNLPFLFTRRQFLATVAATATVGATAAVCSMSDLMADESGSKRIPVGVQLWTLRKDVANDLSGTLEQVAKIGYQGVELWFQKWPAAVELKQLLSNLGLKISGAHVGLAELKNDFDRTIEYHQTLGNRSLVIPYIPDYQKFKDDDWTRTINDIRLIAERATKLGFRVFYHNHDFELKTKIGDVEVLDLIFGNIDEEYLKTELDLFFVADTGRNPLEYLKKFNGRVKFLHLKEKSKPGDAARTTELGRGVIDWPPIFAEARRIGVEWFLVEQDCIDRSALESIRISFEYLKTQNQV